MPIGKNILVTKGFDAGSALVTKGYGQTPSQAQAGAGLPQAKAGTVYLKITSNEPLTGTPTFSIDQPGATDVTDQVTTAFQGSDQVFVGEYVVHANTEAGYEDGVASVTVSGTDAVTGNVTTDAVPTVGDEFNIDTVAPTISVSYDKDRLHLGNGDVVITALFSEDIDTYQGTPLMTIRKENGDVQESGDMTKVSDTVFTYTFTVTGGMSHQRFLVEITNGHDYAGHDNAALTENQYMIVDRTNPKFGEITVYPPILSTVSGYDAAVITFRSNEPCQSGTMTCTVDGNSANLISFSAGGTLWHFQYNVLGTETEGSRPIAIQGTDLAGNVGTGSGSVIFDFTDPTIDLLNPVVAGADLDGGIDDSQTTLDYDTETGTLPSEGVILIDSELIAYTGKTGTQLTGLTRGYNGTTKASHSTDTTFEFISEYPDDDVIWEWSDANSIDRDKSTVTVSSVDVTDQSKLHDSGGEYITP